jgi:hypothetical protein
MPTGKPPHDRQGEPLGDETELTGEWVHYKHAALAILPPNQNIAPIYLPDGKACIAFNAALLAREFGIGVSDLFATNRGRTLSVRWQKISSNPGQEGVYQFAFSLPGYDDRFVNVEAWTFLGRA